MLEGGNQYAKLFGKLLQTSGELGRILPFYAVQQASLQLISLFWIVGFPYHSDEVYSTADYVIGPALDDQAIIAAWTYARDLIKYATGLFTQWDSLQQYLWVVSWSS